MKTKKEAQNLTVYRLNSNEETGIESISLYDHIMESEDITTTPHGVAPRHFVELVENEEESYYTISTWGPGGNNYKKGTERFETEEKAEEQLFQYVWKKDFLPDDQRDTMYYDSEEEALIELKRLINELD